jgi:hypothetical protein
MNGDSYRLNQSKRRSHRASSDTSVDNPTQARKVGNLLVPGNNDPWPEVRDISTSLCLAGQTTSATGRVIGIPWC